MYRLKQNSSGFRGIKMNSKEFMGQLKILATRYKEWRYPAFNGFRSQYSKENPGYKYNDYFKAFKTFETNLRSQNDVLGEVYSFFERNYDVYLNASIKECEQIRKMVTDCYYTDERGKAIRFLEDLFFKYAKEVAVPKLQETGDKIWLTRGLIAMSLENSGIDYRDSILTLEELRKAAIEKKHRSAT